MDVQVKPAEGKGLGLFALRDIEKGELVAASHIVTVDGVLPGDLSSYEFFWSKGDGSDGGCLAFGPVSFANHSSNPNCTLVRDRKNSIICLMANKRIKDGSELTFTYRCPLWFNEKL